MQNHSINLFRIVKERLGFPLVLKAKDYWKPSLLKVSIAKLLLSSRQKGGLHRKNNGCHLDPKRR